MAYLKKVTDAKTDSGVGNGWFKIQEGGYKNGKWATNEVIDNKGNEVIQNPKCIANGQYLLRAGMVALHGARSTNGAQLYMECAQLNITGGAGTASPTTYSIPGIYKVREHYRSVWVSEELHADEYGRSNDPGLLIDIYSVKTTSPYVIPGMYQPLFPMHITKSDLTSTLNRPASLHMPLRWPGSREIRRHTQVEELYGVTTARLPGLWD